MTVVIGLMPITYQPFSGLSFALRLVGRLGLIALVAVALGRLAAFQWPTTTAAALAIGGLGIAIALHHTAWAASSRTVMYLWPGVAAAGCGLIFAISVWFGSSVAAHIP